MNDETDLLPPDDVKENVTPKPRKKRAKRVKLVKVRALQEMKGYNCIYQVGDEFKIAEKAAEMLVSQCRVELVSNADSNPT